MDSPFPDIQWNIDNDLTHQIHTSERRAFRACRRRWDWAYRQHFHPVVPQPPLEFGIAFHKAMEKYYEPMTWLAPLEVKGNLALVAFEQECQAQMRNYQRNNPDPDVEVLDDYRARIELGLGMLRYYCWEVSPVYDRNWTPIRVEVSFEVPIKDDDGTQLQCQCDRCWSKYENYKIDHQYTYDTRREVWSGLPVTYGGRLDMLAQDEYGRYWIVDWKEQPVDSLVLTRNGWVKMGELQVGDYVIGSNGKPTKVLGVYPKGKKQVYQVELRDGTVVECSEDHAWYVKNTHSGKFGVKEARQIMNRSSYEDYAVPLPSGPVEFREQHEELPMHPYILGSLIGDGGFTSSVLKYSSQSGETINLLKKYADQNVEFVDQRHFGSNSWQINGPWRSVLRSLGLWGCTSGSKFIPRVYLTSSVENRILLLQGLADTDGNTGMLRITTTSRALADDIRELIWSLGGYASLNCSKERLHQNGTTINVPQYGINYWLPDWIEPNQLERKRIGRKPRSKAMHRGIKEVRPTQEYKEMQCIRVEADDHLYMTNNFVLTHNTTSAILDEDAQASFLQLDDQISSYVWALWQYGIEVAGFVYVEIKKAYPKPPTLMKRKHDGRAFSVSKTELTRYDEYLRTVQNEDYDAWQMGLYDAHLEWLKNQGPVFTQRHQIHKNANEVQNTGRYIALEAMDIIGNPRIYPQPGRFSCGYCLYKQPCLGVNMGEDYEYTLNSMFEKRDRLYWEEKKPSTE